MFLSLQVPTRITYACRRGGTFDWLRRTLEDPAQEQWAMLVRHSGLHDLLDIQWTGVDSTLVTAFAERWQPATNSFLLPMGEMTITLHDIACMTGLRLDGRECSRMYDLDTLRGHLILRYSFSEADLKSFGRHGGFPMGTFTMRLEQMMARDAPDYDAIAAGWLAVLLTSTLFIDKSTRVKMAVVPLLLAPLEVAGFSWPAAILSCLYRGLGEGTRMYAKKIDGATYLLQVRSGDTFAKACIISSVRNVIISIVPVSLPISCH